jgi:DNA-binding Lrp family transcriptional regulator
MVEPQYRAGTAAWDSQRGRDIASLSLRFVLDVTTISRGPGDLLDPLLVTAILDANQAAIHRDPDLARLYDDAQTALPDDLRRPISINALAKSLRLPFETVRRRVGAWTEAGLCVRVPGGVYVPQAVVTSPAYLAVQTARVERLRRFHADLVRMGFIPPSMTDGPRTGVRAADRALAQYMLRICDHLIELTGDASNAFVLLGLFVLSTRAETAELQRVKRSAPVSAVCEEVRMAPETVRRRLLALQARGLAARRPRGWVVLADERTWPQLRRMFADNEANLRRLFDRLSELQL